MAPAFITLGMGLVLGYLAQRSRICFIGGLHDFILVHDTELLKGALAFFVTAWLAFSAADLFGLVDRPGTRNQVSVAGGQVALVSVGASTTNNGPAAGRLAGINWRLWALTGVGGLVVGLFSTIANGCPTRQHVLAAQGMQDSVFYLAGFYLGVVIFYLLTKPLLAMFT